MELLSPAGSYESLIAAVQSGADAVYLGGYKFGARQSAVNFQQDQMKKWTEYCHLYGVKVYITVNTLVKDSELQELALYIKDLASINVDGLIVQDMGVVTVARMVAPELELHASTQMTITSLEDVLFLENLGFTRVVLSRELSMHEIRKIRNNTKCELEVFVHGALCMSYSGQCLMSSIIGERSGNRGRCAQPCRLPYTLDNTKEAKDTYLLSPKDLCLVNYIKDLKAVGVNSLKIEGRLKRAGYVSTVVGIYRDCIDREKKASPVQMKLLSDAFGRGFTGGFFLGETGKEMMSFKNPSNVADNVFTKEATDRCSEKANFRKIPVSMEIDAKIGKPLFLKMTDSIGNEVFAKSTVVCDLAEKTPTSKERITDAVLKLGDTVYECVDISADVDDGLMIKISEINKTRRLLAEEMNKARINRPKALVYDYVPNPVSKISSKKPEIFCEVNTKEQYEEATKLGIKNIIVGRRLKNVQGIQKSPAVSKNGFVKADRILAQNIGQLYNADNAEVIGGPRLNITNSMSADFYSAYMDRGILSLELSLKEIKKTVSSTCLKCGAVVYGKLELMYCANCFLKASGNCMNRENTQYLKDRKGNLFPLVCSDGCAITILNSKPVYMADKWRDIEDAGLDFVCLVFTDEDAGRCREILNLYIKASNGQKSSSMPENTFTRGHFYRGVL